MGAHSVSDKVVTVTGAGAGAGAGGEAAATPVSIVEWCGAWRIIETARDAFGRVDVFDQGSA